MENNMKIIKTNFTGLYVMVPKIFFDNRGWFTESFNEKFLNEIDRNIRFIQDNHSLSIKKGTLRGLHFQAKPYEQTKLIRCTRGRIFDVVVDLRKKSNTYLKWYGIELSAKNKKMLYIPKGFAHGFITLVANSEVQYKVDNHYQKNSEFTIKYDDSHLDIRWPNMKKILSDKDKNGYNISELDSKF